MNISTTLGTRTVDIRVPSTSEELNGMDTPLPAGKVYGLDVETTRLTDLAQWDPNFRIRLVQIATKDSALVLDMSDPRQRKVAITKLTSPDVWFCSHNNMDVLTLSTQLGVDIVDRNIDTLVIASMAYTQKTDERDLKTLTTRWIGPQLAQAEMELHTEFQRMWDSTHTKRPKSQAELHAYGWENIPADNRAYLTYAGLDAIACRNLLEPLIVATGNPKVLVEREIWLAAQANRIQLSGYRVDRNLLAELVEESTGASERSRSAFVQLTGALPNSTKKVLAWFEQHGADWSKWEEMGGPLTEKGCPSLAKDASKLVGKFPLDSDGVKALELLAEFKGYQDRVMKTEGVQKYLAPDGRVHAVLKTLGAFQTGRMSSTSPNVQNFSKKDPRTRGLFVPRAGHVLVSCDFDQVELRVVAALAGEKLMIDTIKSGGDLHQLTADSIGQPRPIGKMTNFLIVYGGGGRALADQAGIDREVADEAVRRFRDTYRSISDLAAMLGGFQEDIRTVSGRRLSVARDKDGNPRSYANINYVIQSSARDLLVEAWYRFATVYGRGGMVWMPIHDELVIEVPESLLDQVVGEVEECMTFDFMGVPISASASVLRDSEGVSRWGK